MNTRKGSINMDGDDITMCVLFICVLVAFIVLIAGAYLGSTEQAAIEADVVKDVLQSEEFTSEEKLEMMEKYLEESKD